jgi:peptide/nickel transport system substrate-binding protein
MRTSVTAFNVRAVPILVMLVLTACAPGGPASTAADRPAASEPATQRAGSKSLVLALEAEPTDAFVGSIGGGAGTVAGNVQLAVHQWLTGYDDRGNAYPMLATALPSRENGTWVIRPDGTMQTTYRIHSNVTWHDGTPLTTRDFLFGWTVTRDPDVPMRSRNIASQITSIETPDSSTLVMEWSKTYPFAGAFLDDEIGPMPAHLLESIYQSDKERFTQLGYWTREFVGVGPYRLAEWSPGSHMTLRAYDSFFKGRPKIDTITLRFISNAPTAVASLLSGAIDGAIPRTLDFSDVVFVKEEWERQGKRPVAIIQPTHLRVLEPQFRDPAIPEIQDVRFRRALLHAIDRTALVDALLQGTVPVADSLVPPDDGKYAWVSDVIARYPYDQRRALELLGEVGWRRDASGAILDARGQAATIPLATSEGAQATREQAIIADNWRALGLRVDEQVRTAAEARDNRLNSIFPGFSASAGPLTFEHIISRVHSVYCPTDQNRWSGANHGCYRNPEHDRIVDALQIAIDESEQRRHYRDLVRLATEDLPYYPLYYNPQAMILRDGVTGVKGDTKPRTAMTWNVTEWDVR